MGKSHTVLFRRTRRVFSEPSLPLYGRFLSVVRDVRFLGMIFDERLTWVPPLKSLRLAFKFLLISFVTCPILSGMLIGLLYFVFI